MKCKVYPLIVSLIVLLASSCNSKASYDYEEYGLNCPVKSVKVTTYNAESKFGDVVKGRLASDGHYLAKFNAIGNLEEISWFDDDGNLNSREICKYNDNNQLIENSVYYDDKLKWMETNEYIGAQRTSSISLY